MLGLMVLDESNLQAIEGASLFAGENKLGETDQDGRFTIQISDQVESLRIEKENYQTLERPFDPENPILVLSLIKAPEDPAVEVSGILLDVENIQALPSTRVLFNKDTIGRTDKSGRFKLTLHQDLPLTIQFFQPGYLLNYHTITKPTNNNIIVKLRRPLEPQPDIVRIFGRVITDEREKALKNANIMVKDFILNNRQVGTAYKRRV